MFIMAKWNVLPCSGTTVELVQPLGQSPHDTTVISEIIATAHTPLFSASEPKARIQPTSLLQTSPPRCVSNAWGVESGGCDCDGGS